MFDRSKKEERSKGGERERGRKKVFRVEFLKLLILIIIIIRTKIKIICSI